MLGELANCRLFPKCCCSGCQVIYLLWSSHDAGVFGHSHHPCNNKSTGCNGKSPLCFCSNSGEATDFFKAQHSLHGDSKSGDSKRPPGIVERVGGMPPSIFFGNIIIFWNNPLFLWDVSTLLQFHWLVLKSQPLVMRLAATTSCMISSWDDWINRGGIHSLVACVKLYFCGEHYTYVSCMHLRYTL